MNASAPAISFDRIRCYYRPILLIAAAIALLCTFWFTSRYPALLKKQAHLGQSVATMAYGSEVIKIAADAPTWKRIFASSVNWLDGMKIGMTFGVLFGALLHTWLRYYPLKIGRNLYVNSIKGALVGVPMAVCANCSVPVACGVTRGHGRVEVALGFLFSSPNFNPVVMMMTFTALPLAMSLTKYAVLLFVIVLVVPGVITWLERKKPLTMLTAGDESSCAIPISPIECTDTLGGVVAELSRDFARHVWMLAKPTITLMLLASLASAAMIVLIPWDSLLAEPSPGRLAAISMLSTLMPVPIALDVMFASQLHVQGVAPSFVMLFAMTLGTYSVLPSIYLWREVSRTLAVVLFAFFALTGFVLGMAF